MAETRDADPKRICADQLAMVTACKERLGLGPTTCYPKDYQGECYKLDFELKKCFSFAVDPHNAAIFYDKSQPRAARQAANRALQSALKPHVVSRCEPQTKR
jgi:hypothetical protein